MAHPNSLESHPILTLENVTKQFSGSVSPAVSSVSLTLDQGNILALLGPSGCGKTTLLRLIAGFEYPEAGTVLVAQQTVASSNTWVPPEKRGVGMVFQDYALFPHLTASQNITFGLNQKPKALVSQSLNEVLTLVGLGGMGDRYPHQLSGGQQQRVALARALAPHPFLVLLDEPLSNLDVQVRLRLRQELRDILKAAGTSAVFVTHDQEEALSIADQVAVMRDGRLEQVGTPEEVYCRPASRFVAEFVTQANFLPAQFGGQGWETAIGTLPDDIAILEEANLDYSKRSEWVEFMIRQEDLTLHPDEASPIIVRDRQFLGREYCYCLQIPQGHSLFARTSTETALPIGMPVQVTVSTNSLRAFPVPAERLTLSPNPLVA
ncbi:ABC transporter ATP-binding protein [filamentous cyanobacterium CCP1]|nr:ABC transporter ATP-binding protein [filamentous cyanobacterium CCP2]PSB66810.1 ABC transporter ATP-binding protein [filamentous cyanobacterium CCP1]